MNRSIRATASALLVAATLGLAACATGPTITSDADASANFAQYRTFAFYKPLAIEADGYATLTSGRIKAAARSEMEARGYVYDEAAGSQEDGLAPGTRWEDIPDTWVCPDCGTWVWEQERDCPACSVEGRLPIELRPSIELPWFGDDWGGPCREAPEPIASILREEASCERTAEARQ